MSLNSAREKAGVVAAKKSLASAHSAMLQCQNDDLQVLCYENTSDPLNSSDCGGGASANQGEQNKEYRCDT